MSLLFHVDKGSSKGLNLTLTSHQVGLYPWQKQWWYAESFRLAFSISSPLLWVCLRNSVCFFPSLLTVLFFYNNTVLWSVCVCMCDCSPLGDESTNPIQEYCIHTAPPRPACCKEHFSTTVIIFTIIVINKFTIIIIIINNR